MLAETSGGTAEGRESEGCCRSSQHLCLGHLLLSSYEASYKLFPNRKRRRKRRRQHLQSSSPKEEASGSETMALGDGGKRE